MNNMSSQFSNQKNVFSIDKTSQNAASINHENSQQISPELIITLVSKYYGVSVEMLCSKSRRKEVLIPRWITMYLCRNILDMTIKRIGDLIGGRDSTSVIHALENVDSDPDLLDDVEKIKNSIIEEKYCQEGPVGQVCMEDILEKSDPVND